MITLRQLLSHTSGVRPYLPEPRVDNYNHLDSAVRRFFRLTRFSLPVPALNMVDLPCR